ncbi:response regulator [Jeongeupia wiesaeckerbachi]|uniref:response regulator n=1 Tax=Jeongeupia wiesaeckerbachi TaxID=3051218 RepID=UPI003D80338A
MPQQEARILVVDDEPFNLEILGEHLTDVGYEVVTAEDGEAAWSLLTHDRDFDTILLDRMMPRMDGMALLARLKQSEISHIPVIMQTAVGAAENVREGLAAGAYYYLIKPFQRDMLLAIVGAAVKFYREKRQLESQLEAQASTYRLLERGEFRFRTLDEARQLTLLLSNACPEPQRVAVGLSELLVNAVEHGNLGISYADKTRLLQQGRWQEEVEVRLASADYRRRNVHVAFEKRVDTLVFTITDEGEGFEWQPFLEFSPERAFDPHGRGISMARMLSFDSVEYQGCGNAVIARVLIADD